VYDMGTVEYPERNEGEYVLEPEYCGQAGSLVTGELLTSQSGTAQISPLQGSYQTMVFDPEVVWAQPVRSVLATMREGRKEMRRRKSRLA
jgi:hypothetical protein